MDYHNYIVTRFSIYDKDLKLSRLQYRPKYKEFFFSNKRLDFKFFVFEKITLNHVVKQTNQNFTWLIYTSNELPDKYKKKLINMTKKYPQIKINYVNSFSEFSSNLKLFFKNKENYFSIRLDDDDGLRLNFLQNLQKYKSHKNCIISTPRGIQFTIGKNNKIILGKEKNIKLIALGLAANNMDLYNCGDHTKLDKKFKVIYDNMPKAYLLCCSPEFCFSKRRFV
jgi:hypothetical protein